MKKLMLVGFFAFMLLLSGCFQVSEEITLHKDGSGTVVEEVLFSDMMLMQMQQMAAAFGGGQNSAEQEVHKPAELKAQAASMGEGVTYKSSEAISRDGLTGYRAVYSFSDINTLKLSNDPSSKTMNMGDDDEEEGFYQFTYKKGTLTIKDVDPEDDVEEYEEMDGVEWEDEEEYEDEGMDGMNEQMMQMFKDMKISVAVVIDGKITKTNAMHQDGNRITLMEIDYNKIMEDPEAMKKLKSAEDLDSMAAAKQMMKDVPGIKVEIQDEVTVSFK